MNRRTKALFYQILPYLYMTLCIGCLLLPAQSVSAAAKKATNARIHFINLDANNDAILLECNGAFGMVDSGEDSGYPDGSSKRYPWRAGIVQGKGQGANVVQYLKSVGVKRLEFYIGTHPHSDHIGNAHTIIKTFRPKRVYLRPYKDSYITNKTRLWDNLYVYDNTLNAIKDINRKAADIEDGITLIQYLKPNAAYIDPLRKTKDSSNKKSSAKRTNARTYSSFPTYAAPADGSPNEEIRDTEDDIPDTEGEITVSDAAPAAGIQAQPGLSQEETVYDYTPMVINDTYDAAPLSMTGRSKPQTARHKFTLGDGMTIEIMNYDAKLSAPDANYFCLGVKVTANGSTAFLSGDINNYRGDEDRLASRLGHVDILKLGHHGYYGSNTTGYLKKLSPRIAVLMGTVGQTRKQMWDALASTGTRTYITTLYAGSTGATIVNMNSKVSTNISRDPRLSAKIVSGYSASMQTYLYMKNGKKVVGGGFQRTGSTGYYFPAGSSTPVTDRWLMLNKKWYYFGPTGRMNTGWVQVGGSWYHCDKNGAMQTGWIKDKGKTYYLSSKGAMVTGDKKIGKYWYYFRSNGSMYTGWLKDRYYYDEQGRWIPSRSKSGWQKYEAGYKWRYKDGSYARNTWKTIKGSRYYFNAGGYRCTGLTKIGGRRYYFSSNGKLTSGWQTIKGRRYYFKSKGMCTGFQIIKGRRYYFYPSGALCQKQGMQTIGKKTYFFNSNNTLATGWKTIKGQKYHFSASGVRDTGWKTIGGYQYYLSSRGPALTGFQTINGYCYLFSGSGILRKAAAPGWYSPNGTDYYYFQTEKTLRTGWLSLQTTDSSGTARTRSYYLDPATGLMATGLMQLPDRDAPAGNELCTYYFYPPQTPTGTAMDWGMMAADETITISRDGITETYRFDENGKGTLDIPQPSATPDPETPSVSENDPGDLPDDAPDDIPEDALEDTSADVPVVSENREVQDEPDAPWDFS